MAPRRKATGNATIALVAIIVVIVGATGLALLARQPVDTAVSVAGEHQSTIYSTISPQGLQLQVKLNTTAIRVGGALTAQVSLFNTLAKNLSLVPDYSAMKKFVQWDQYLSLCGSSPVFDAFSFALFQGHYTSANISQAVGPLRLAPPALSSCPASLLQVSVQKIEFAGGSYLATISTNDSFNNSFQVQTVKMQDNATTGYCETSSGTVTETITKNGSETTSTVQEPGSECGPGTSLYGYWTWPTANDNCFDCNLHPFPIGSYTLVAEDVWNQTVYAYFQVSTSGSKSPVEVVSVTGPIPPYNPGGPVVYITPRNVANQPITSLNATLAFVPPPHNSGGARVSNSTMIIFSVPLGTYSYTLSPSGAWYFLPAHGSGSVTVTGSDVMVQIPAECHP